MILKNLGLSYALVGLAFLVLVLRLGHPYHRILALVLYGISWVPFILSIERRRGLVRLHRLKWGKKLKTYLPHIVLAVLLGYFLYVIKVLVPVQDSAVANMTSEELADELRMDMEMVRYLNQSMHGLTMRAREGGLLSKAIHELTTAEKLAIKSNYSDFLQSAFELDLLQQKYKGFYLIDYVARPQDHAQSFLLAYYAFTSLYRSSLEGITLINTSDGVYTMLNEADFAYGIPAQSAFRLNQHLTNPDTLLRLNAGRTYLPLMRKDLAGHETLLSELGNNLIEIDRLLGNNPEIFALNPLELLEHQAFKAWFPLQKQIAVQMSYLRTTDRAYFITVDQLDQYRDRLEPGDILIERRNWHVTNLGIPGFWPHLALYTGTLEEMDAYFAEVQTRGGRFSEAVREVHPEVHAGYQERSESGRMPRVIEAKRDGVIVQAFGQSAGCDYLAVLRPRVSKKDKMSAVLKAFAHYGKPYDYNFDFATDNAMVCSELIYKAYEGAKGLVFETESINGRMILPPNQLAEKFDAEFDLPEYELEFVLFLDGSEAGLQAIERDAEAFRKTWQRAKWDIMQD
ncbi:MAG: hypothetical protein ACI9TH_005174 [Kiritimatiellia bacterium]|jgi:hypothetical protein